MHYFIYETTNKINGKKYRGAHISTKLNDDYLGSGKILLRAISKYGAKNFERSILEICNSVEDLFQAEEKWVNKEWVSNPNTYNLKVGGDGGWDYVNSNPTETRWTDDKREIHSIELKKKNSLGIGNFHPKNRSTYGFLGKHHSAESKLKISTNNGSNLSKKETAKRIKDLQSVDFSKRGVINELSKLWNVSHTTVRRFQKKYLPEYGLIGKPPVSGTGYHKGSSPFIPTNKEENMNTDYSFDELIFLVYKSENYIYHVNFNLCLYWCEPVENASVKGKSEEVCTLDNPSKITYDDKEGVWCFAHIRLKEGLTGVVDCGKMDDQAMWNKMFELWKMKEDGSTEELLLTKMGYDQEKDGQN